MNLRMKGNSLFALAVSVMLVVMILVGTAIPVSAAEGEGTANNQQQIEDIGGSNPTNGGYNADGIKISKTITPSEDENYFDITLNLNTRERVDKIIKSQDMAVVVVLDVSWSMVDKENLPSGSKYKTQYAMAKEAADSFIDKYCTAARENSSASRSMAFVNFNTNAVTVQDWIECKTSGAASTIKNHYHSNAASIFGNDQTGKNDPVNGTYDSKNNNCNYYNQKTSQIYTNIEGGLKLAQNLMSKRSEKYKYIILLTDGFPTTYSVNQYNASSSSIEGWNPRMADRGYSKDTVKKNRANDGYFYDILHDRACMYGTSYSEKAAQRASKVASNIKSGGNPINVQTIGINVGGQKLEEFQRKGDGFSVVQWNGENPLEINRLGTEGNLTSYQTWLKKAIGSNSYYNGDNSTELNNAFKDILAKIDDAIEEQVSGTWLVSDPMNSTNQKNIDFKYFYNKSGKGQFKSLSGTSAKDGENTASFDSSDGKINWDIKKSGYKVITEGKDTVYQYSLKYRIRLKNERDQFAFNTAIKTNGKTTLTYIVRDGVNLSGNKTLDFPIPEVEGYKGALSFTKVDDVGYCLSGVEFTLTHKGKDCAVCHGDANISEVKVSSDGKGKVAFENIPSGHEYQLKETKTLDGYIPLETIFDVKVAYGKVITNLPQDGKVVNEKKYVLPETGGMGTTGMCLAGLVLVAGAAFALARKYHKSC